MTAAVRVLLAVALALAGCVGAGPGPGRLDVVFLATPEAIGVEMLRVAGVTAADRVYDLGSGDGRLVFAAVQEFGARGVGVEIDPALVQTSRETAAKAGIEDRATFVWQDLFTADIGAATVVTLYLGEHVNLRLRPKLLRELQPGTRVVSHDFAMDDWRPDRVVTVRGPHRDHRILFWVVPADAAGAWRETSPGGEETTLTVEQRFQRVQGTLAVGNRRVPLEGALTGPRLALAGGGFVLEAIVDGDGMTGRLTDPAGAPRSWLARRLARS